MKGSILVLVAFGICWLALAVGMATGKDKHKQHSADAKAPPPADKASGDDNKEKPIPRVGDETSVAEIKARPENYVGKTVILCGGVRIRDVFPDPLPGMPYTRDRYCNLGFYELGKDTHTFGSEDAIALYLPRQSGGPIIDSQAEFEKKDDLRATKGVRVARVKAVISPDFWSHARIWRFMDVVDVQFCKADVSGWQPWVLEDAAAKTRAIAEKEAEAAKKAEADRKAAEEAAKWRTWTDASGKHKIEAEYGGVIAGKVKLTKRDGTVTKIPLEALSKEDQQWIKTPRKKSEANVAVVKKGAQNASVPVNEFRTWTDVLGQKFKAKFEGFTDDGKVQLIKRDGEVLRGPLSDFSKRDQEWILNQKR